ncbi:Predicted small secreted protein [Parageobacillus thermantarcticus]|uniref:Predicted small secreted protein n=1 Tax=Parageobacillus thermantarcticus TaxID=186116 RepID=A0A1I0SJA1_9BACL|nr:PepSY domain-containing protein [Parageobacillus thermantarcticus]SFA39601.1 Predicted small secreted protein [Parageobacillus thermantarcticus]
MNWKKFIIGAVIGFAAAYIIPTRLKQRMISAEKALSLAKASFQQQGTISGSWIQTNPETYKKNNVVYTVYKGGVCRDSQQYEFVVDAYTGAIIETKPL